MSDGLDFLPFRKATFRDAGDHGLAMCLETQVSTDRRVSVFGCFLSVEQGTQLVQELLTGRSRRGSAELGAEGCK